MFEYTRYAHNIMVRFKAYIRIHYERQYDINYDNFSEFQF